MSHSKLITSISPICNSAARTAGSPFLIEDRLIRDEVNDHLSNTQALAKRLVNQTLASQYGLYFEDSQQVLSNALDERKGTPYPATDSNYISSEGLIGKGRQEVGLYFGSSYGHPDFKLSLIGINFLPIPKAERRSMVADLSKGSNKKTIHHWH